MKTRGWRTVAGWSLASTAALVAGCGDDSPSALDPSGPSASRVAGLWWLMLVLATLVAVAVLGFIGVALVRGRGTEGGRPSRITDNGFILVGGIAVPVVILAVLAVATVVVTNDITDEADDPLIVEVTGERWWWRVGYPEQEIDTANELHVPVGRPVEVRLESDNVVHSFWIPQLAPKVDLIPGQPNRIIFTASAAGTYRGQCAEFCGIQHANMNFVVVADEPADFDRWVEDHRSEPATARGESEFRSSACAGCHTVEGVTTGDRGPDLTDFGSRQTIAAGALPNTPENLRRWITDPHSVKPGSLMPPVPLTDDEVDAIVDYLDGGR